MLKYLTQKKEDKNWNAFQTQRRHTLRRDGKRCLVCGITNNLTAHHIVHKCKGGTNNNINLMTVCIHCHRNIHEKFSNIIPSGVDPLKHREILLAIKA